MSQPNVHSYKVDARNNSEHLFNLGIVPCIPGSLSLCQQPSSLIMPFPERFCRGVGCCTPKVSRACGPCGGVGGATALWLLDVEVYPLTSVLWILRLPCQLLSTIVGESEIKF
jgi:hypothetical protein